MPLVQIANCQLLQSVNVKSGTGMGLCKGVAEALEDFNQISLCVQSCRKTKQTYTILAATQFPRL